MSDVTFYPHCNPITTYQDYKGTFASPEDAIEYARGLGCNVVQRDGDSDTYAIGHITKVSDYGVLKYAFGKNVGRNCNCAVTRRSKHHQKEETKGQCVDPFPLLGAIEHLFVPLPVSARGYDSAAWLIDSYKMVTVGTVETGLPDPEAKLSPRDAAMLDTARKDLALKRAAEVVAN